MDDNFEYNVKLHYQCHFLRIHFDSREKAKQQLL